jgi:hypothetical protein
MVAAAVASYQKGEASLQRSPFAVALASELGIVQYGSQPETIRRGAESADAEFMTTAPEVTPRAIPMIPMTAKRVRGTADSSGEGGTEGPGHPSPNRPTFRAI